MKTRIDVADRREAELLKAGLADETTRAFVKVMGVLSQLPSNRSRERVLRFFADYLQDDDHRYPMKDQPVKINDPWLVDDTLRS